MLNGKTIIVTGAASGIGTATASMAQANGAYVISVDINVPVKPVGRFIQADLSEQRSIDRLILTLPSGLHGLANLADLPPTQPSAAVIKVNLVGLKYLTLGLIDKLADDASIVNLTSLASVGWPDAKETIVDNTNMGFDDVDAFCKGHNIKSDRSYLYAKEAVIAWTMQSRWTWRARGIRMNTVSPGPVDTPISKLSWGPRPRTKADTHTMERPATPANIAQVINFLLSDESNWIRGTNIPVDGGMFANIQYQMHGLGLKNQSKGRHKKPLHGLNPTHN